MLGFDFYDLIWTVWPYAMAASTITLVVVLVWGYVDSKIPARPDLNGQRRGS
jgi:hypothetical protein